MNKQSNVIKQKEAILWVNLVFIGMAALLVLYYVMMANTVASKNYRVQTLREEIESLSGINGDLMAQKISLESPAVLAEFASAQNLEEVRNVVYIFENKDVARR